MGRLQELDGLSVSVKEPAPLVRKLMRRALKEVNRVVQFGERKHGTPGPWSKLTPAQHIEHVRSHLEKWEQEVDNDEESGINNLAHAACRLLMALEVSSRDQAE